MSDHPVLKKLKDPATQQHMLDAQDKKLLRALKDEWEAALRMSIKQAMAARNERLLAALEAVVAAAEAIDPEAE
jgi:phytoene/squalene synthetase